MSDPQSLPLVTPRRREDAAAMAVVVQANLVALKVACARRAGAASDLHGIRTPPPGAVRRFRELLIDRQLVAAYTDDELIVRTRQVWGEFCLLCWAFAVPNPHEPPAFADLPESLIVRCPGELLAKEAEVCRGLWRLRFEQRLRYDRHAATDPQFLRDHAEALAMRLSFQGVAVRDLPDDALLTVSCEYAGMLGAVRWLIDDRSAWEQAGIMNVEPTFADHNT